MQATGEPERPAPGLRAPLVGRDRELARLRAAVNVVAGGAPRAVLLTGPPGVGKTRLAEEALALAAGTGFATFRGRGRPLAREVAFAPLSEALGPWLRGLPQHRREELVGDLPQLGLVYAGLGLRAPPPLGDPELERTRLIDALARLLERLARDRPVGLLLDDVHARDRRRRRSCSTW